MPDLTQAGRLIRIYTPLGDDVLVPRTFEGREEMSRLYEYRIECASENASIAAADIVGKRVTLAILQSDMSTERYFDGFVSDFIKLPRRPPLRVFYEYELKIVPWLWFLTRTANCRIFQEKSVTDIVKQIFSDGGFSDFSDQTQSSYPKWTYCVQYRETAFDFVSRLMEKEGIFYFFKHEKGKHTLILADKTSAYQNCEYQSTMRMEPAGGSYSRGFDSVQTWERHYRFRSGKWTQTDYNFETPTTSLQANETTIVTLPDITKYELFDYPGEYDNKGDGSSLTKLRMEEVEAAYDTAAGESDCRSFASGFKFTLTDHEQSDQNQAYTLLSVMHRGSQGSLYGGESQEQGSYQNSFTCFPATVQFRPERLTPKALVHGTQTAVVVGPSGEEISTDQYGRVKVQFFWDRLGQKDENSSCWIRVSQPWAGKNWGGIWIPRIGQEVVVDFLEGDPDRPLIVGRVYNEQQTVPYTLPDNSTQSGFKSRSSKGGGSSDYNELRFEDKTASEEIHIQAQKDLTILVKNDETRTVQHDRSKTVSNNETSTIGNNRNESVGSSETGSISQNRQWTIGQNDNLSVGQNLSVTVGTAITIEAGTSITITCGGSSITLSPGSIVIQAPIVQIN